MSFTIVLSPEAVEDIDYGFDYYNKLSEALVLNLQILLIVT